MLKSGQKIGIGGGIAAAIIIAVIAGGNVFVHNNRTNPASQSSTIPSSNLNSTSKVQIVAAENFWGNLVSQLGGMHVQVLSIVTDPNADPHEYESNAADAQALSTADFAIVNGAGYDDWTLKLISAGNNPNQKVLNVADLLGKKQGDNPHFWYSPYYVNATVKAMYSDLLSIDPPNAAYYRDQYVNLNSSLGQYNSRIKEISQQFSGTKVASTESIFEYLADATNLELVSPPEFMRAVAEGNDPPAQSVVQFQHLIQNGNASVLVYNAQTVTPITQNIKAIAAQQGIPIVAVTETIQPPDVSFQDWMNAELISLQNALNAKALGK